MTPRILLFLLCFLGALHAGAQIVFPIQVEQRFGLLPSRLTDFGSDPLAGYEVSVNALDPFEPSVQIQLRLRIEGPNLRITSRPNIVRLHQVDYGAPLILSGTDLAYLFAPGNLNVEGIDARDFWAEGGLLTEGFYNVCLEAFLPARSDELGTSAENCVPLFVNLAEPPLITYPVANQTIPALTPANFGINWLDQGIGGMTKYDLEITPYGNPPGLLQLSGTTDLPTANGGFGTVRQNLTPVQSFSNDVFLPTGNGIIAPGAITSANAPLIFRSGLDGLNYQLQPDDPALIPGGQYLIRVRAYDPFGTQNFRNGGWSQPVIFTYGERCPAPSGVSAIPVSDSQVRFSWANTALTAMGYTLRFRSRTGEQGNWTSLSTNTPTLLVDQLTQNTAYDYELRANCGGVPGNPTFGVFTTPGLPNTGEGEEDSSPTTSVFAGEGDTPYQPEIASCSPDATPASMATGTVDGSKRVTENENFKFYGLDVRAVSVSGGTSFNGKGTLLIPWLEQGAIAVNFRGVKLNAAGEAVMGTVTPIRGKDNSSKVDLSKFRATLGVTEDCANYTETQLDARGFDDAGVHYLTGTTLDPYDFDQAGNYRAQNEQTTDPRGFNATGTHTNGTDYDDNGCDRDSLNQYGQPCAWRQHGGAAGNQDATGAGQTDGSTTSGSSSSGTVNTSSEGLIDYGNPVPGAATTAGTAYLGTIPDDSLRTLMQTGVDTMLQRIGLQIQGYAGLRSLLAGGLDYYLTVTGLDRAILVGPNDEFLQPGMSRYFPNGIPPTDSTDREFLYWGYDKAIRGLYRLDKHSLDTLQPLQTLYQNHRGGEPSDQLFEHLKRHLRALSPTRVNRFTNNASELAEWIRRRISIQVSILFRDPGAGYSEWYVPSQRPVWDLGGPVLATDVEEWTSFLPPENNLPDLLRSLSVTSYDPALGFELPLKIEREIGGQTFRIYIDDLKFSPAGIQVDAFCILPIPGKDGEYVAFKGENIPLTKGGFQGKQKLSLVSQLDIGLGTYGTMTLPTNSETYVEFSCEGYEGFSLDGQVLFCRDKLIPVDANGALLEAPNRVTADFQIEGTQWPNFLIQLDVDKRFAVKGLRDIYWLGNDIWVDFSEDDSPEVVFPDDYQHAFISGGQAQPQWRGVHIRTLDVTVDVLAKREDGSELGFTAQNLVVDNSGLTVKATARNVLTKEEGRIGKWKIGVDTIMLHLQQSAFRAARIVGDLVLPTDDADEVGFVGQANSGLDFSFSATLEKEKKINWDMWDGELTLAPNTSFEILRSASSGWDVRAKLYGRMNLGIEPTAKFTVPDIVFEDFRLASFRPYVDLGPGGRFGIEGAGVNLGGFGIEVKKLALVRPADASANEFGVDVAGKLSFMGGSGGFGAEAGTTLFGTVTEGTDGLDFAYDRLRVNDIFLATKIPGVMINGGVRFFDRNDHPTYGDGFQGLIDARFDGVGLGLKAAAQFGSMTDYRYWFVDAAALLKLGVSSIPLVGVIHLTGIGGGASYHMTRSDDNEVGQNVDFTQVSTSLPPIGTSITNINYVPDQNTGLGLRLMGAIATFPTASVMNGAIVIGAEFTERFGISRINLDGSAAFMTPPKLPNATEEPSPTVAAGLSIEYLHRRRELNGSLRGYLDYGGVIVGGNTDSEGKPNYLGSIDFHVSPSAWKLWMGTPQQPLSVKIKPLNLTVGTYLDIGSTLPAFPALPPEFSSLGLADLSVPAGARGFMHGFDASIPTGPDPATFSVWRVRAAIRARFGYNMMLTNSLDCAGRDNFGIGGWFLQGNAYAGFYGAVQFGTSLKGDRFSSTVNLVSLDAKAAVQLRGPNPTFFQGAASIKYDVLGWSGSQNMSFAFGSKCNLISVPPPAIETDLYLPFQELIAYSQPAAGQTGVDVTADLEVFTVEELKKEILVPQGNRNRFFRINAREADVSFKDLTANKTVPAYVGTGSARVFVNPNGTLTPDHEYELSVRVFLEEKINGNWVTFRENGQEYDHSQVIKFTTGDLPDLDLIAETRPANGSRDLDLFTEPFFRLRTTKLRNLDAFIGRNWELDIRQAELYADGAAVPGTFEPGTGNYDKLDFTWKGENDLQPETDYEIRLRVGATRKWYDEQQTLKIGDDIYEEEVNVSFRTSARAEKIPESAVVRAYPGLFQYNTYRDLRSGDSYLELGQDLVSLFGPGWLDETTNKLIVRYLENVSRRVVHEEDVRMEGSSLLWSKLPTTLGLDKTYELQFVISPIDGNGPTDSNVTVGGTDVAVSPAEPTTGIAAGKVIFQYWFRTSRYPTWKEKVVGLNLGQPTAVPRQGVNSPRIWDQSVPQPDFRDSVDYPYVEDLTVRALGTDVYRGSTAPGELLSQDELTAGGLEVDLSYVQNGYVDLLARDYFNWSITQSAVTCNGDGSMSTGIPVTWSDLLPEGTLRFRQQVGGPTLTATDGNGLASIPTASGLLTVGASSFPSGLFANDPTYPSVADMEADRTVLPGHQLNPLPNLPGKIILLSDLSSKATVRYNQSWAYRRSVELRPAGVCNPEDFLNTDINENDLNDQLNPGNLQAEIDLINNAVLVGNLQNQFGGFAAGGTDYSATVNAGIGGHQATVNVNTNGTTQQFSQTSYTTDVQAGNGVNGGGVANFVTGGVNGPGGFSYHDPLPPLIRQIGYRGRYTANGMLFPLPDVRGRKIEAVMIYRMEGPGGQSETYYSDPIDLTIN